jgi:bacillithiol biosynthesis deacetylase BshB1
MSSYKCYLIPSPIKSILFMKINTLAFAAHPDDAELSCVGTLLVEKRRGQSIGIIDLTQGELGSRGSAEIRAKESTLSSEILGLDIRENLKMEDGFFENNLSNKIKIIEVIRNYQPDIVLANAPRDRHPDHGRGSQLVKEACFLAGLSKIITQDKAGNSQKAWRPKKVFFYMQDFYLEPDFIIDISAVMDIKMKSILSYDTQFSGSNNEPLTYISSDSFLESVKYRNRLIGKKIGVEYGEGFILAESHLGLPNFENIILPEIV